MKGYKAFKKGMTCRGKQYRENKTYEEKGDINLCEKGMHFCKKPLDVLNYYPDTFNNEYAEVEAIGKIKSEGDKTVTDKLTIKGKISISNIFKIHFDILFDKVKKIKNTTNTSGHKAHANTSGNRAHANTSGDEAHANTSGNRAHANTSGDEAHANTSGYYAHANTSGDEAHANTSGYYAHANTSGDYAHANTSGHKAHANTSGNRAHANTSGDEAHANTSGDEAHANTSGDEAISCAIGISSKAKASKGWVIITNWVYDKKYVIKNIYSKKVGQKIKGVTIKADTWYWFENGELKSQKC